MGWRMPSSVWQGEGLSYQPTCVGATCSREAFDTVLNCAWKIDGMRLGATWRDRAQGTSHLLLEQEIHGLWVKVFTIGKYVLRTSMGSSKAQVVHALPHHLAYCKVKSHQVYLWEALTVQKNRKVVGSVIRIWHPICISEGHQRKYDSRLTHKKS